MDSLSKDSFHFNEETLKSLIQSFESLKASLSIRELQIHQTLQSSFFKIPFPLILRRIFSYLDEDDLIKLGQTSIVFRKMIYSPIGLKILLKSRVNIIVKEEINENQGQMIGLYKTGPSYDRLGNDNLMEGEDTIAQLMTLRNVKDFLTEKIKENELIIGKLRAEIEEFRNQLRIEKQINAKSVNKIQVLEGKINNLEKEKKDFDIKIKNMEDQFKNNTIELENQLKNIKTDKDNLANHKKVLVTEVKKLRDDLEKSQKSQIVYIDALKKLKSAFVTSELYQKLGNEPQKTD